MLSLVQSLSQLFTLLLFINNRKMVRCLRVFMYRYYNIINIQGAFPSHSFRHFVVVCIV